MSTYIQELAASLYKKRIPRGGHRLAAVLSPLLQNTFVESIYGPSLYYFGHDLTLYNCLSGGFGSTISNEISELQTGDAFIDVGANIGLFTILAANRVGPSGRVVACEPQKDVFDILQKNIDRNNVNWVQPLPYAISDRSCRMAMNYVAEHTGAASLKECTAHEAEECDIDVRNPAELESFQQDWDQYPTIVMKTDTEGNELNVLKGFGPFIDRQQNLTKIIVEICPDHLARFGATAEDIYSYLGSKGFDPALCAMQIKNPALYDQIFVR